mgnify:FL=1
MSSFIDHALGINTFHLLYIITETELHDVNKCNDISKHFKFHSLIFMVALIQTTEECNKFEAN